MPRIRRVSATCLLATAALMGGCDSPTDPPPPVAPAGADLVPPPPALPSSAGAVAFATSCAECHASRDGFDLAYFGFPDSTIVRRAVAHVDTATALLIVAHVRSLDVLGVPRGTRPFQVPKAASDVDFARRLFGRDVWPADMDEQGLLAIDPTQVAAAVDFPVWSDESSSLDWMPAQPLSPEVLGAPDGPEQRALALYYQRRADPTLARALAVLRRAARDSVRGPCAQSGDGALADPAACFETTRWIATLGAQHVLRTGRSPGEPLVGSATIPDAFWDVGQAARRSLIKNGQPVPDAEANWVDWMYLGWVFAPGRHASSYTAGGLTRVGLPRHATFVALRSMAARPEDSPQAYSDLATTAMRAPSAWVEAAYGTGLSVLEARTARGWRPGPAAPGQDARTALGRAAVVITRRLGVVRAAPLVARTRALAAAL